VTWAGVQRVMQSRRARPVAEVLAWECAQGGSASRSLCTRLESQIFEVDVSNGKYEKHNVWSPKSAISPFRHQMWSRRSTATTVTLPDALGFLLLSSLTSPDLPSDVGRIEEDGAGKRFT